MTNNNKLGVSKYHKYDQTTNGIINFKRKKKESSSWDAALPLPDLPSWISITLVCTLAAICYIPSLNGDFVFDDSEAVINNEDVRPSSPIKNVFFNDYWGTRLNHPNSHKSYRPLTVLSFRLNYWLNGGLKAQGFKTTNLLLHIVISALSLRVFDRLFGGGCPRASLVSALLFAVHPIHCEAVAGIVGRADLLCALGFFLAFLAYCEAVDTPNYGKQGGFLNSSQLAWIGSCLGLTLLSMLCKEQGITVLGLCSVYDIMRSWREGWRSTRGLILRHIMLGVWGFILILARWIIMGGQVPTFQPVDNPASFADSLLTRILSYNYVYALNAWLLLCPEWLCFDWAMGCIPLVSSPTDKRILAPIALWTVLVLLATRLLLSLHSHAVRVLLLSMALLVGSFVPASNLLFRVGFVLAERVLYLPSAGFCALISLGLRQLAAMWPHSKIFLRCGLLLLLLSLAFRSGQRSLEWRTERQLFRSALKVCPLNAKVHYNVAKNAADTGNRQLALEEYQEALKLHPGYEQAMNNLGNLLRDSGYLDEAEQLLTQAVSIRPSFAAAWMNLGIVQAGLGRHTQAEQSYRTALLHRPRYPDCYYNLGNLFLDQERYEQAYKAWRNATALKPTHAVAWSNMVIMLDSIGDRNRAETVGEEALQALPNEPGLHFNLANTLGKVRQFERAEYHFLRATALEPANAKYHANLGVLYHRWKKFAQAETSYLHALQLEPNLQSAKDNLQMLYRTMSRRRRT